MLVLGSLINIGFVLISALALFLACRWLKWPKAQAAVFAIWLCLMALLLLMNYEPLLLLSIIAISLGLRRFYPHIYWALVLETGSMLLWLSLTGLSIFLFYENYWRWRDCFNELGRCYDTHEGVMTEAAGPIWGTFTLIFGLLFLRALWKLLRRQTAPEAP